MNKRSIYIIIPFISIIIFFNIITFLTPDKDKSESENRTLVKSPTVVDLQNGTFANKYEKYFNDHIILREKFVHLSVIKDLILNKTNINGKYVIDNKYILEDSKIDFSNNEIENTAQNVVKFNNELKSLGKKFTYIMTPRKTTIQQPLLPNYIQNQEQELENANYFFSILNSNDVDYINVLEYFKNNFTQEELKEFYFRTDHHWNSIGAYNAFKYIINESDKNDMGFNYLVKDEEYDTKIIKNIKFLGSLNKPLFVEIPYETEVPYVQKKDTKNKEYFLLEQNKINKVDEKKIVARKINTKDFSTYSELYTDDLPYYKVVNKDFKIDKKLTIFKDSYENAMTWLITDLFKEVEVVDLRHTGDKSAIDFVRNSNPDIVWIMYNNRNLSGDIFKLYGEKKNYNKDIYK